MQPRPVRLAGFAALALLGLGFALLLTGSGFTGIGLDRSFGELLVLLLGPGILAGIAALALYLRLPREARPAAKAALWAGLAALLLPLLALALFVLAMLSMGNA